MVRKQPPIGEVRLEESVHERPFARPATGGLHHAVGVERVSELDEIEVEDDAVLAAELRQAGLTGPGLLGPHPVPARHRLLHRELTTGRGVGVEPCRERLDDPLNSSPCSEAAACAAWSRA